MILNFHCQGLISRFEFADFLFLIDYFPIVNSLISTFLSTFLFAISQIFIYRFLFSGFLFHTFRFLLTNFHTYILGFIYSTFSLPKILHGIPHNLDPRLPEQIKLILFWKFCRQRRFVLERELYMKVQWNFWVTTWRTSDMRYLHNGTSVWNRLPQKEKMVL